MSGDNDDDAEKPTVRQLLHWATGDREAEAEALADSSDTEVTEDEAEIAVKRAHGDLGVEDSPTNTDVASPSDADAVHEEQSDPRR